MTDIDYTGLAEQLRFGTWTPVQLQPHREALKAAAEMERQRRNAAVAVVIAKERIAELEAENERLRSVANTRVTTYCTALRECAEKDAEIERLRLERDTAYKALLWSTR